MIEQTTPSRGITRTGGDDAVAFTSGPAGAPFSAGVVHAWLAADRKQPLVATGISMGAVAAAAMRRVYEELEHVDEDHLEVKRWRWFQRYHQVVTENPFAPLWKALPDPVDFFAETPPVQDPSIALDLAEDPTYAYLLQSSEDARRHFYLLVRLGGWLGTLPVRVSSIATAIVMYVRTKEGYGRSFATSISLVMQLTVILAGLWIHAVFQPKLMSERQFSGTDQRSGRRPLFGWGVYLLVLLLPPLLVVVPFVFSHFAILGLYHALGKQHPERFLGPASIWVSACTIVSIGIVINRVIARVFPRYSMQEKGQSEKRSAAATSIIEAISANLGIAQGLLHPFEIQRSLFNLFIKGAPDYVKNGPAQDAVKALFVCAALQETEQISLKETCKVVDALTAALSAPGVLPPQKVAVKDVNAVDGPPVDLDFYDVIDGAAVRNNPIPAFFHWCRSADLGLLQRLERPMDRACSLHVVYSVPTGFDGSIAKSGSIDCPDIVDSAFIALRLAKRRDTRQEVRQANTVSRLESIRRHVSKAPTYTTQQGPNSMFTIFADEIAPREDIDFGNDLAPDSLKLRTTVADGCRGSLETLYYKEIRSLLVPQKEKTISCAMLLTKIAPRRKHAIRNSPGLPAVCQHCTRVLEYRLPKSPEAPQDGILQTYGGQSKPTPKELSEEFPQLAAFRPKVIFLGSGGVFRGAFHIGVVAAMKLVELYPDIVVGASVGTLMGGALCRMTAGLDVDAPSVLSDLTDLFIHVDREVAVTSILKSATKQLGIRARAIRLSPASLARRIRAGSQADAGYAATGAPPELTDALSSLLTIPHTKTIRITADFVAGHFSAATAAFLTQVRRETLPSFNIQNCVMGVSLLETVAKRLLQFSKNGDELSKVQPYLGETPSGRQVAFFGTTSFLNSCTPFLLGRDFLSTGSSWNTVQQGLCSSAFPAVFEARSEMDLLPGVGRSDRFFADGGMFDNLPFFPAFEVIADVQGSCATSPALEFQKSLQMRSKNRNLIICAGLNEKPERAPRFKGDTLSAIHDRAQKLSYESKTNTFLSSTAKSNRLYDQIIGCDLSDLPESDLDFLNRYVPSEIVDITPTDAAHINGTFAFCKTLGMEPLRIQASIADGCFQTLKQLTLNNSARPILEPKRTLVTLATQGCTSPKGENSDQCPYFRIGSHVFQCPFVQTHTDDARAVYKACCNDPAHKQA